MTTKRKATADGQPVDKRKMFRQLAVGLMRMADEKAAAKLGTNEDPSVRWIGRNGLKLVVKRTPDGYTLGVWRQNVQPSDVELEVVRDCFSIPEDAMQSTLQRHRPPVDRTKSIVPANELWLGYAINWSARKVSAMPTLPGVEPATRP